MAFARTPSGIVTQILSSIQDITEQKTAQMQLQLADARLRYLLSANPAVLYACNATGDFAATFVSDNVVDMMGYQSQEFLNDSQFWASHIHPEDAPRIFAELSHLFETDVHIHDYRFLHSYGQYRWVRDELKLLRDREWQPLRNCWVLD